MKCVSKKVAFGVWNFSALGSSNDKNIVMGFRTLPSLVASLNLITHLPGYILPISLGFFHFPIALESLHRFHWYQHHPGREWLNANTYFAKALCGRRDPADRQKGGLTITFVL